MSSPDERIHERLDDLFEKVAETRVAVARLEQTVAQTKPCHEHAKRIEALEKCAAGMRGWAAGAGSVGGLAVYGIVWVLSRLWK